MRRPKSQTCRRLKEQVGLIKGAKRSGAPFAKALARVGWSYDDLVYEHSRKRAWKGEGPSTLEEIRSSVQGVPFVSFFTGCGGMDLGLEAAGFSHVAAFEINELFCKTLRRNRPKWKIFGPPVHSGDVSRFEEVAETLKTCIRTPFPGLFAGGPPCQPFSIAANQRFTKRGTNFKRIGFSHETSGNLLFDFLQLIIVFRPKAFLLENVPGLRDLDGGEQLREAIKELQSNGYRIEEPFVLDASHFGVPQQRVRLFVVGSRGKGKFKQPAPSENIIGCGSILFDDISQLQNNETRQHNVNSISRYTVLSQKLT